MIYPKVKDILSIYIKSGINKLIEYFEQDDLVIEENSWIYYIKKELENKQYITVEAKLELLKYKLELIKNNKNE